VVGGEVNYSDARAEAERIISKARNGRDPFIGVTLLRSADISTFEGLLRERFLADPSPGRRGRVFSEATRSGLTRTIRKELIPVWGRRDPNSIQRQEVQNWAKAIAEGKGRKRAAPYLANGAVDYMAMVYSWAVRREILRYTPFLGLEKPFAEQPRTRSLSNDDFVGSSRRWPRHPNRSPPPGSCCSTRRIVCERRSRWSGPGSISRRGIWFFHRPLLRTSVLTWSRLFRPPWSFST
jgi:hypothetical protein